MKYNGFLKCEHMNYSRSQLTKRWKQLRIRTYEERRERSWKKCICITYCGIATYENKWISFVHLTYPWKN